MANDAHKEGPHGVVICYFIEGLGTNFYLCSANFLERGCPFLSAQVNFFVCLHSKIPVSQDFCVLIGQKYILSSFQAVCSRHNEGFGLK
jgi:hypothetical protein